MPRDTGIAQRLRNAGLRVIEVDGWQSRGSTDFDPDGSVNHHTAGGSSGATPSLNTCINGRPDLAGPLCNVFQSRESSGEDIAYVVAAGKANHAGEGGWKGLTGNKKMYGLEIEHTGTSTLSTARQKVAARIHAAMFSGDVSYVCQHSEWAPSRKIDAATDVNSNTFRNYVAEARGEAPKPPPSGNVPQFPFPSGHWMGVQSSNPKNHSGYYQSDRPGIAEYQQRMLDRGWSGIGSADGIFGSKTQSVTKQYQQEKGLAVDGLVGQNTWNSIWTEPIT